MDEELSWLKCLGDGEPDQDLKAEAQGPEQDLGPGNNESCFFFVLTSDDHYCNQVPEIYPLKWLMCSLL